MCFVCDDDHQCCHKSFLKISARRRSTPESGFWTAPRCAGFSGDAFSVGKFPAVALPNEAMGPSHPTAAWGFSRLFVVVARRGLGNVSVFLVFPLCTFLPREREPAAQDASKAR